MLDIGFIREQPELVKDAARRKGVDFDVYKLIDIDTKRRELQAMSVGDGVTDPAATLREEELALTMKQWQTLMLQVPNIPDISVPQNGIGPDGEVYKEWGDKNGSVAEPSSYLEIMQRLSMLDQLSTSTAPTRVRYFLKNDAVGLCFALWQYANTHFAVRGLKTMIAPSFTSREQLIGTAYLPDNKDSICTLSDATYLANSAEVSSLGYFMSKIIPESALPQKLVAWSPCFKWHQTGDAYSLGDLLDTDEFYELVQVVLLKANHLDSVREHEVAEVNNETLLEMLGIPYRVRLSYSTNLTLGQVKRYDLETWVPATRSYRFIGSSSYSHDFYSRRLNIRYIEDSGKKFYAHLVLGNMMLMPQLLLALLENHEQADGSVSVPPPLVQYLGKDQIR